MVLIFWSSAQSGPGDFPEWAHVVTHFTEYAALAALWTWALWPAMGRRSFALAAAICFLYAISDEIHQSHVPGRYSDPWDVVVDSLGIAFALAALYARGRAARTSRSGASGAKRRTFVR
jgi:VanZ family protein